MPNNTSIVPIKLPPDMEYYIPKGYHTGNGKILAYHLSSVTPGTATASDIVSGKTAWVDGTELTGTMDTIYVSNLIMILEDYDNAGYAEDTMQNISYDIPEAKSYIININCEQLGGTGFFQIPNISTTITKQFTIQNEINVGVTITTNTDSSIDIKIRATNIGTEYLYYNFYADIVYTY